MTATPVDCSFNIVQENSLLTCAWNPNGTTKGEIVFNNITRKRYDTVLLNEEDYALRKYERVVMNGDKYMCRFKATNNDGTKKCKQHNITPVWGQSVPVQLNIEVIPLDHQIGIKLLNYDKLLLTSNNGYSEITEIEVLIDDGDNEDDSKIFYPTQITSNNMIYISDLSNGVQYEVVARQININGSGEFSIPADVTPSPMPHKIEGFEGVESNQKVDLTWTPPNSNDFIEYHLYMKQANAQWIRDVYTILSPTVPVYDANGLQTGIAPRNSYSYTGLTNGVLYNFKIVAMNSFGPSEDSVMLAKSPYTLPGLMNSNNVRIVDLSDNSIKITLLPPNNNGKLINQYKLINQLNPTTDLAGLIGANPDVPQTMEVIVSNLALGVQQLFQVSAMNDGTANTNIYSFYYTQYANPGCVTNLVAETASTSIDEGKIKLSWALPANMGGATSDMLTHYISYSYVDPSTNLVVRSVATSRDISGCVISSLRNGTVYTVKVRSEFSTNGAVFVSSYSSEITVIPYFNPDFPASVTVLDMSDNKVKINWLTPNLGGLNFDKYKYKIVRTTVAATSVNYTDVSGNVLEQIATAYLGDPCRIYMKTQTDLPASGSNTAQKLESLEYISNPYTFYEPPSDMSLNELELYPSESSIEARWGKPDNRGGYPELDIRYDVYLNGIYNSTTSLRSMRFVEITKDTSISICPVGYVNGVRGQSSSASAITKVGKPHTDPLPPTSLTADPSSNKVVLNWDYSASKLNQADVEPYISYVVFRNNQKIANDIAVNTYTDYSVVNGTKYVYQVVSKQIFKDASERITDITYSESSESPMVESTPYATPSAPQNLNLNATDRAITASWTAPSNLGGLDASGLLYFVELYNADGSVTIKDASNNPISVQTSALNYTFNNLVNGTQYTVKVSDRTWNSELSSYSAYSTQVTAQATPNIKPRSPTEFQAVVGDSSISLSWVPVPEKYAVGHDDYSTQSYEISVTGLPVVTVAGGATASSYVVSNLINGAIYSVSIRRITTTANTNSDSTTLSNLVPYGTPIVKNVTSVSEGGFNKTQVTVNPNGSRITGFIAYAAPTEYTSSDILGYISPVSGDTFPSSTTTDVVLTATRMRVTSSLKGTFYAISNAAGFAALQVHF